MSLGVGGALVLLLWAGRLVWRKDLALRGARWLGLLWIFGLYTALSATWATNPWRAIERIGPWLGVAAIALALLAPSGRRISLRVLATTMSVGLIGGATLQLGFSAQLFGATNASLRAADTPWLTLDLASYAAIALPLSAATALRYAGTTRIIGAVGALIAATLLGFSGASDPLWAIAIGALFAQILLFFRGLQPVFLRTGALTLTLALIVLAAGLIPKNSGSNTPTNPDIVAAEAPDLVIAEQHPRLPRADGEIRFPPRGLPHRPL